jgi:hypothetical protein
MTAIFEEIRRLEAARKNGEISAAEFAEAKGRMLEVVEEATVLPLAEDVPRRRAAPDALQGDWTLIALGLAMAALFTFVAGQLIGSMTIALTLTLSLVAAVLVAAARGLRE